MQLAWQANSEEMARQDRHLIEMRVGMRAEDFFDPGQAARTSILHDGVSFMDFSLISSWGKNLYM